MDAECLELASLIEHLEPEDRIENVDEGCDVMKMGEDAALCTGVCMAGWYALLWLAKDVLPKEARQLLFKIGPKVAQVMPRVVALAASRGRIPRAKKLPDFYTSLTCPGGGPSNIESAGLIKRDFPTTSTHGRDVWDALANYAGMSLIPVISLLAQHCRFREKTGKPVRITEEGNGTWDRRYNTLSPASEDALLASARFLGEKMKKGGRTQLWLQQLLARIQAGDRPELWLQHS